jgi:hypothetical protein
MENNNEKEAVKEYLKNRDLPRERIIRFFGSIMQNYTRQLLFVASILAGFIFTILFDLILAPQYISNLVLSIVFAFLLLSGFSLLVTIIIGVMLQFIGHPEILCVGR